MMLIEEKELEWFLNLSNGRDCEMQKGSVVINGSEGIKLNSLEKGINGWHLMVLET